jgi:hypothetical protein
MYAHTCKCVCMHVHTCKQTHTHTRARTHMLQVAPMLPCALTAPRRRGRATDSYSIPNLHPSQHPKPLPWAGRTLYGAAAGGEGRGEEGRGGEGGAVASSSGASRQNF